MRFQHKASSLLTISSTAELAFLLQNQLSKLRETSQPKRDHMWSRENNPTRNNKLVSFPASSWQRKYDFLHFSCQLLATSRKNLRCFTIYLPAPGNLCKYFLFFALKLPASSWLETRPTAKTAGGRSLQSVAKHSTDQDHRPP